MALGQSRTSLRSLTWLGVVAAILFAAVALVSGTRAAPDAPPVARVLAIDGAIGPALADYLVREIAAAQGTGADVVVLRMNTPGGLITSMRAIVQAVLASPIPVIGYVAPEGAHAASAGTYILLACHVAAMAPGTNVGAATPIDMGGPGSPATKPITDDKAKDAEPAKPAAPPLAPSGASDLKAVNDMVALIRSLAEARGRNADWAERAVREAATLTAQQAVTEKVVDLVAPSLPALLDAIDGRIVTMDDKTQTLHTKGAQIVTAEIGWATRILMVLTDPNIAFILMTLGIYGMIFELANPGAVLPGLLGGVCLLLGLYALSVLPVNYAAVGLIILGVLLLIGEAMAPGVGLLGLGGITSFALGALFLVESDIPGLRVSWTTVAGMTTATALFFVGVIGYALSTHRRKVTTGREDMIGRRATVLEWTDGTGFVLVEGERWQARSLSTALPLPAPTASVVIKGIDGLVLLVDSVSPDQRSL